MKNVFTLNTMCLFLNNIFSLYIVLTLNKQVLQSSKVRLSATTHFFVPLQRLFFNFLR